jgi:hypothetical protein
VALDKRKRKPHQAETPIPLIPFDEALKRMLSSPPKHKTTKKKIKDQKK